VHLFIQLLASMQQRQSHTVSVHEPGVDSLNEMKGRQLDKSHEALPGTLGLASGEGHEVEDWLTVASTTDATSSSGLTMISPKRHGPPTAKFTDSTLLSSFNQTPRGSFEQLNGRFLTSFEADSTADTGANDEQQTSTKAQLHESRESSVVFATQQMHKMARYYATALSKDDIQALVRGEKNHNLKQWLPKDLVIHHESRKDLVPRVMPKVEKIIALADIEHGRRYSQRAMIKTEEKTMDKVRRTFRLPRIKVTTYNGKEDHEFTSVQSALDFCSTSSSPVELPPSPSRNHTRSASSSDYFSHRPAHQTTTSHHRRISSLALSSGPSSDSSTRVRSPLAQEIQHRHNPEVTFDSFLAPHKSGKGETFHDTVDAKPQAPRLGKMPSMPHLRKRTEID
jgi:hypothetical protein